MHYVGLTGKTLKRAGAATVAYVALVGVAWLGFKSVPEGFIPQQDKEYLVAFAQLPEAATLDRTEEVIRRMTDIMLAEPGVAHSVAFPGLSVNGFVNAPNVGIAFVALRDFEDPNFEKTRSANEIAAVAESEVRGDPRRVHRDLPAAADSGLGHDRRLQAADRGPRRLGYQALYEETQKIVGAGWQTPGSRACSRAIRSTCRRCAPTSIATRRWRKACRSTRSSRRCRCISARCTSTTSIASAARIRSTRKPTCRSASSPRTSRQLKVRNAQGDMVPLGSFVSLEQTAGPDRVMHYNGYPSAEINGGPAPGYSSGEAEALIAGLAEASLPNGMHAEWTELTYQKQLAGNAGLWVFPLSVLLVFLVLAALYESLTLPLVVILIVPMTLLSAIAGVWLVGGDNNIFTQIGLIVLVGLAAKNAILIVEFARTREQAGASTWDAIIDAARLAAAADPDDVDRVHGRRRAARAGDAARAPRCATRWASPCSPA